MKLRMRRRLYPSRRLRNEAYIKHGGDEYRFTASPDHPNAAVGLTWDTPTYVYVLYAGHHLDSGLRLLCYTDEEGAHFIGHADRMRARS